MWRDVMLKEVIAEDTTLTAQDVNSLNVGDYLIPITNGFEPEDQVQEVPLFIKDKTYKILEVKPPGVVIESEKGNWWLDFSEGLGKFFRVKQLTSEEQLGELESLPYEIMKLLNEHGDVPRSRIITAMIQMNAVTAPSAVKALRANVIKAIGLLFQTNKIQQSEKVGIYKLTPEGLKDMWEGGATTKEKWEQGTF